MIRKVSMEYADNLTFDLIEDSNEPGIVRLVALHNGRVRLEERLDADRMERVVMALEQMLDG